jgi:hypothetical protein
MKITMGVEAIEGQLEDAEEAGDSTKLLELITTCAKHGGDDEWTEVAEASLDALYRLAKGGTIITSGLGVIFSSLKAWKAEDAIVEVGLGCVVSLTKTAQEEEVNLDMGLIMSILQAFPDESTIQEQACLAIEGLASASDKLKGELLAIDGIKDELAAAKERITNERNKAYPGRAAKALGIELEPVDL